MKDKEYIKQIRYKEDEKLPMTDQEKADLEAFYQSVIDEENKYLIPANQRAEERNRQLDKRIEEMEKRVEQKRIEVERLARIAAEKDTKKEKMPMFSTTATLEERLTLVEKELATLKQQVIPASASATPWWEQIFGTFADSPNHEEAMRLGREYRESLRPAGAEGVAPPPQ
jgi:hypothetical protein